MLLSADGFLGLPTEAIAPTITGSLLVVSGIIAGAIALSNRKKGAIEGRAPTAQQAWQEADDARRFWRWFEDRFYTARAALKHLMRDVSSAHPDWVFTKDVEAAVKLGSPEEEATQSSERTPS